jgi:hypothetical protein
LDQSKFDEPDASDSDYEIDESDSEEDNEPTESDQSDSKGDNHPTNRLEIVVPPLTRPQSDYHLLNQIQTIYATINNIEIDSPEPTTYKEAINSAESKE